MHTWVPVQDEDGDRNERSSHCSERVCVSEPTSGVSGGPLAPLFPPGAFHCDTSSWFCVQCCPGPSCPVSVTQALEGNMRNTASGTDNHCDGQPRPHPSLRSGSQSFQTRTGLGEPRVLPCGSRDRTSRRASSASPRPRRLRARPHTPPSTALRRDGNDARTF